MSFSALDRELHLARLSQEKWDLVIIGGGITGAGILLDAVSRGLKAALIEKGDFASGTSSRSTKLIHGGLRYLKKLEIGLVREVGKERAIVHANARHLVRPEAMLLPIYHDGSIGRITGSIGLWFYDVLADVDKAEQRRMLSREEALTQEPLLRKEGLLGAGLYYEYRTDDARLTLSILKTAVSLGGLALNYCEAIGFRYNEVGITGVQCTDTLGGRAFDISALVTVNATGPWADAVRNLQNHAEPLDKKLLLSKGVHIVVPATHLPIQQSMYFDTPEDGRMVFAIPRDRAVYIGTTDTEYQGPLDNIQATTEEKIYLTRAVNHVLEDVNLQLGDITGSWAGVRPLIYEEGKTPAELSRRDEVFISPEGLISIAGGKLTGYRKMAERIVDLVLKRGDFPELRFPECRTHDLRMLGSDFGSEAEMLLNLHGMFATYPGFSRQSIEKLFGRYGSETKWILEEAVAHPEMASAEALTNAEAAFAVRYEMTHHLADFVHLRISAALFEPEYLSDRLDTIVQAFTKILNWDEVQKGAEIQALGHLLSPKA